MSTPAQPAIPPLAISESEGRLPLAGGRLFFKSWTPAATAAAGAAAPILLLHDSLGSVELWRRFPEQLAAATGRRVIAYDRLGFGRSDPHPGRLGADFIADEGRRVVPELCRQLGLAQFIACGHSVGGGMAVEAAAGGSTPAGPRCLALVTIAAQAFVEDRTLAGIRAAQEDFRQPANRTRLERYHGPKAPWVLSAWIDTWLAPGFAAWTLEPALAALRCPVLALHGERDEYGSEVHPRRIAAGRGHAHILAGTGHMPQREREAEVLALIAPFLAGV